MDQPGVDGIPGNGDDVLTTTQITDPVPGNNSATDTDTVGAIADVSVTKTDSPDPVFVNDPVTYTITVSNAGPSDAASVTLTDALPVRLSGEMYCLVAGVVTCASPGDFTNAWTGSLGLGDIDAGTSVVVKIRATVDPVSVYPPGPGTLSNTASAASGSTFDPNDPSNGTPNNSATQATTVQLRTDSLVYTGGTAVQYSDSLSLSAVFKDTVPEPDVLKSGIPITFTVTCPVANSVGDTSQTTAAVNTDVNGVASTTLPIYLKPQAGCTIVASFAGDNVYEARTSSSPTALTLTKEDAAVTSSDPSIIGLTSANKNSSGNLISQLMSITVDESNDSPNTSEPSRSLLPAGKPNLTGLQVNLYLVPVGAGTTYGPCVVTNTAYDGASLLHALASCTFNNIQPNLYEVDALIVSDYFVGPGVAPYGTAVGVLLVYDPTAGMTTGGGWVTASDGSMVNFGFNAKFLKSGQAQGNFLAIWHRANGIYVVKSNSMGPSAVTGPLGTLPNQYWIANLTGKSTYQIPSGTLSCGSSKCGNYSWSAYVEDIKDPGAGFDHFWMKLLDPSNNVVSAVSMGTPILANQRTLGGGNIQIPH